MDEQTQTRIWIIASKFLYESPNLDKQLANLQILCNLFSYDNENEKLQKEILAMIKRTKEFRKHKVIRKQEIITDLKVDADDLVSKIIHTIDPKIIQMVNAFDMN
jgi:hypothetical protein